MKKIILVLICFVLSLTLSACQEEKELTKEESMTIPKQSEPNNVPSSSSNETPSSPKEEVSPTIEKGKGIYIGQIDTNSIEIKTEQGNQAFQLTDETQSVLADITENQMVYFGYSRNEYGQYILESWLPSEKEKVYSSKGTYVGMIDGNSVEIKGEDGPNAFQLSDHVKESIQNFKKDDEVTYTFVENTEKKQMILQSIEKSKN